MSLRNTLVVIAVLHGTVLLQSAPSHYRGPDSAENLPSAATKDEATGKQNKSMVEADDETFSTFVHEKSGTVVVAFHANWCAPCRVQHEILREASSSLGAAIVRVNAATNPKLVERFNVAGLPLILVLHNDRIIKRHEGIADGQTLKALVGTD